jgi:hypothetical protein
VTTKPFEDLPPDEQAKIRELVATAPPLSTRQRERLEMLFRQPQAEAGGE